MIFTPLKHQTWHHLTHHTFLKTSSHFLRHPWLTHQKITVGSSKKYNTSRKHYRESTDAHHKLLPLVFEWDSKTCTVDLHANGNKESTQRDKPSSCRSAPVSLKSEIVIAEIHRRSRQHTVCLHIKTKGLQTSRDIRAPLHFELGLREQSWSWWVTLLCWASTLIDRILFKWLFALNAMHWSEEKFGYCVKFCSKFQAVCVQTEKQMKDICHSGGFPECEHSQSSSQ